MLGRGRLDADIKPIGELPMCSERRAEHARDQADPNKSVPPAPGPSAIVAASMLVANLRIRRDIATASKRPAAVTWHFRFEKRTTLKAGSRPARPDDRPADVRLSQFYTDPAVATWTFAIFREHFASEHFLMVEPSAGEGAFLVLLPDGWLAFDLEPKHPGIEKGDFLLVAIESDLPTITIGNPPFGRNSNLAKQFFNHAASQSLVIAMILPRTFRKASIQNQLDRNFHLFREVDIPEHAFLFRSKRQSVPSVFQIWIRQDRPRPLWWTEKTHADFKFTDPEKSDFAIRRIGVNAGRICHDPVGEPDSFHFIRGDVLDVMSKIDFASVARDVAGIPNLSRAEVVGLYDDWIKRHGRSR